MKRFHEKNPLMFALVCIGVYVVAFSLADGVSAQLGVEKLITVPVAAAMTLALVAFIFRNGLQELCGLGKPRFSWGKYLYFLPLLLLASTNLWQGICPRYGVLETVLYILSMIGVGILEEIIFRGFLFTALRTENLKRAVIISSLTFGIGHIVNLLNGAQLLPTLLQLVYATAAGFLFTVIFLRSGSLLPCIAAHCLVNSLSVFSAEGNTGWDLAAAAFLTVVSVLYALWILKKVPEYQEK